MAMASPSSTPGQLGKQCLSPTLNGLKTGCLGGTGSVAFCPGRKSSAKLPMPRCGQVLILFVPQGRFGSRSEAPGGVTLRGET